MQCEHLRTVLEKDPFNPVQLLAYKDPCWGDSVIHPYVLWLGYLNLSRFKDTGLQETCRAIYRAHIDFLKEVQGQCQRGEALSAGRISLAVRHLSLSSNPWQLAQITGLHRFPKIAELTALSERSLQRWIEELFRLLGPQTKLTTYQKEECIEFHLTLLRHVALIHKTSEGNLIYLSWWDLLKGYAREGEVQRKLVECLDPILPLQGAEVFLRTITVVARETLKIAEKDPPITITLASFPRNSSRPHTFLPFDTAKSTHLKLSPAQSFQTYVNDLTLQELRGSILKWSAPLLALLHQSIQVGTERQRTSLYDFFAAAEDLFHYAQEKLSSKTRWTQARETLIPLFSNPEDAHLFAICDSAFVSTLALYHLKALHYDLVGRNEWQSPFIDCLHKCSPEEREDVVNKLLAFPKGAKSKKEQEKLPCIEDFLFLYEKKRLPPGRLAWLFFHFVESDYREKSNQLNCYPRKEIWTVIEKMENHLGFPLEPEMQFAFFSTDLLPQSLHGIITALGVLRHAVASESEFFLNRSLAATAMWNDLEKILILNEPDLDLRAVKRVLAENLWHMTLLEPVYIPHLRELPPLIEGCMIEAAVMPITPIRAFLHPSHHPIRLNVQLECQWIPIKKEQATYWKFQMILMSSLEYKRSVTIEVVLDIPEGIIRQRNFGNCLSLLFKYLPLEKSTARSANKWKEEQIFQKLQDALYALDVESNLRGNLIQECGKSKDNQKAFEKVYLFLEELKKKFRKLPLLLATLDSPPTDDVKKLIDARDCKHLITGRDLDTFAQKPSRSPIALFYHF